jgi:branched-chain amino acid aminotransferase
MDITLKELKQLFRSQARLALTQTQSVNLYAYVNGRYVRREEASISIYDHGFLYGDGVYEAIRAYDGIVFKLREHLDRLYESAKSIKIELPFDKQELGRIVVEVLKKNQLKSGYVRIVVSRGAGKMGVDPRNCTKPTVVIMAEPREPLFGEKVKGISAIISSLRRTPSWSLDPRIKTLNYLNNVLAKIEAIEAGVEEAIMLNEQGYVAETSTENVFVVKNGTVATPHPSLGVLRGITRDVVVRIVKELGYPLEERPITVHELFNADEVLVTGTAAEVVPVIKISGRIVGDGKVGSVFSRVTARFRELANSPQEGIVIE